MDSSYQLGIYLATLLIAALSVSQSLSSPTELLDDPFHLSWKNGTTNSTNPSSRLDFIFSLKGPLKNDFKLKNAATDLKQPSLSSCTGYSACLLSNGTKQVRTFALNQDDHLARPHKLVFTSIDANQTLSTCNKSFVTIENYCNTHWNPPTLLLKNGCNHTIEWHSPYSCQTNTTNYERPCYFYDPNGKLIDLTPWILSNGSSYQVETTLHSETVKQFSLNVCNEAHSSCGPNTSSCYLDGDKFVESGYNNLTSIEYQAKDKSVILTTLGQYNSSCADNRVKTKVKFLCSDKKVPSGGPKLVEFSTCESVVEWRTTHACPVQDISAPANDCAIKYGDVNIDLKSFTNNSNPLKIPLNLNGNNKTMLVSLCKGLNPSLKCEGKERASTTACLYETGSESNKTANNSIIVGSTSKSSIRLADTRIHWESFAVNKTCVVAMGRDFNATMKLGTRIEFYCAPETQDRPTFLEFQDCVYVFEWGTPLLCLEAFKANLSSSLRDQMVKPKLSEQEPESKVAAKDLHRETLNDSKAMVEKTAGDRPAAESPTNNKMNKLHKFLMIGLIMVSLAAFIVIIFVLDKKTRIGIPLGRHVFQQQQVPYNRVDNFNDLDL